MRLAVALALFCTLTAAAVAWSAPHASAAATAGWSAPATLIPNFPDKYGPFFDEAENGDAVLAYIDTANASTVVTAYNYTAAGGWSGPAALTNGSWNVFGLMLVVDPSGQGTLMYQAGNGVEYGQWSFRFQPGLGWSAPIVMPLGFGNASFNFAAAGPNGDVFAAWEDFNDTISSAQMVAHYTPAAGWDSAAVELAEYNASGQPIVTGLAVAPDGEAAATLTFFGPGNLAESLWYTPGVGWGAPRPFPAASNTIIPILHFAGSTALFSWAASNGTHTSSLFQTYSDAAGWSTPVRIENLTANVTVVNVVGNDDGNLTATFLTRPTSTNRDVWARHYTPVGGWEPAVALDTSASNSTVIIPAAGARGDFLVTWSQGSGTANRVLGARYLSLRGWQPVVEVAPQKSYLNYSFLFTRSDAGAMSLWTEAGAPYAVGFSIFSADTVAPPISVSMPGSWSRTAGVVFAGATEPGAEVWVDGNPASVDAGGNFTVTVTYGLGPHSAEITARDFEGNINRATATFTVDPSADLAVGYPNPDDIVTTSLIPVRGSSEPGARVTIDGVPAAVDSAGLFSGQIILTSGSNIVTVAAVDLAGNTATVAIRVTYLDLIGNLSAQITNITASLNTLLAAGSATQAQLDAARAGLATAEAQLAAANASLAGEQTALASANANLTAARDNLAASQNERDAALTNLTVAQTRLSEAQTERDAANQRAQTASNGGGGGSGALDLVLAIAALGGVALGFFGMMQGRKPRRGEDEAALGEAARPKP